eukprot:TRINITY_DN21987_c0_g1_i1.p2 TRINITY_DN21987_c0_g1~~TRINITY_DN21987_c0_g1_i1.p2  ORF type:complete len:160 (+),score=18.62 TRINITY_DN21987_c0_g1_i1:116-595(+)
MPPVLSTMDPSTPSRLYAGLPLTPMAKGAPEWPAVFLTQQARCPTVIDEQDIGEDYDYDAEDPQPLRRQTRYTTLAFLDPDIPPGTEIYVDKLICKPVCRLYLGRDRKGHCKPRMTWYLKTVEHKSPAAIDRFFKNPRNWTTGWHCACKHTGPCDHPKV